MKFNNSVVDANLFAELIDLTAILSKQKELNFEYQFGSYVDLQQFKVTASRFWDHYPYETKQAGYKTDVMLRVLGTLYHTSTKEWKRLQAALNRSELPFFLTQLFTLLEDLRLEEVIRRERKGTAKWFNVRKKTMTHYFETQLETNVMRNFPTDELFCMIYLTLTSDTPVLNFPNSKQEQVEMMNRLQPLLTSLFEAASTKEIVDLTLQIMNHVKGSYSDSVNTYFVAPINHETELHHEWLIDDLKRHDELDNDDRELLEDEDEVINEQFSTWHRENENSDRKQSFLRYELEHGTKTNILGDGARDSEDGDQAMASVQGFSGMSKQTDYSKLESLNEQKNDQASKSSRYGKENVHAVKQFKKTTTPSFDDIQDYQSFVNEVTPVIKQLKRTIEDALDYKKNTARSHLLYGRLAKKQLIPLIIDDNPRVFYKKDLDSNEIDAAFTLLIDCSASMYNKMDETKKAAIIYHEVLKQLKIPHTVTGFWEDGFEASDNKQPNYFHTVIPFEKSLDIQIGPEILQLEAEEDNRDGFSIRVAAEELIQRYEKHKMLLVFTDGEPSAYDYSENGIIDTHEAVLDTRKQGIDVIGLFLSNDTITEDEEKLMRNIYGRQHMLIESMAELPNVFSYILKRLLLKAV
ncbi:vWA domain-containing protein [Bacillaceae bacterium W0354]